MLYLDQICKQRHAIIIKPLACVTAFLHGRGFAEHHSSLLWSVSEMLLTLEPHGIFRSNLAYLLILAKSSHWYAKHDEALRSINLAGRDLLVKMFITLERHDMF